LPTQEARLSERTAANCLLPHALPADAGQRIALYALRRMAAGGIADAHAANLFFTTFGLHFRRPLVLIRAFMLDMAQCSRRTIRLAPCCAPRMTEDEARLLDGLRFAGRNPALAARQLAQLVGHGQVCAPLGTAAAFGNALADLGRPLSDRDL
ncbi:MAG: DUF6628 family protein, partial [Novosphingobium sp.]